MRNAENLSLKPQIIITEIKQILMPLLQKKEKKESYKYSSKIYILNEFNSDFFFYKSFSIKKKECYTSATDLFTIYFHV